ncbi:restriction endonuclease subunit S [Mycoplasma mycoides subsp. capri]|uniref:restriction endonuclease subunit S n=1 Tax=Mycoplasma mycoides TaxID=2102 RepID=UPI00223F214F|nr:restriction endonuclease subunit S [Mycoplasma mycoides]UZK64203.1 restriction endonuclease subunit S [Mycoplasma mycoides subsp. capri]
MFLSVEDIETLNSNKFISEWEFKKYYKNYPTENDILMTRIGDIGSTNVVRDNSFKAYYVSLALLKYKKTNPQYLNSAINSSFTQQDIWRLSLTTVPPIINKDEIGKVNVCVTGINEQEKIGNIFSNLDSLITLHQWECNFWKFRNFVFDFLKFSTRFFKKIQKYTHTWEQEKLGNLGVFKSSSVDKIIRNNEQFINLINYMDVYNKLIITSKNINKLMRVTASKKQINECSILKNDVLFTPSSETADDIAHSKVIEETLKNTLFSYHLIRYRPNQNIFYSLFPDYLFDTNHFKKQASLLAKGVQRFVLGKPEFESLNVIFPNINEQTKITKTFRYIDSLITLHQWECNFWKFRNFVFDFLKFSTRFFKKIQKYTHTWEQWKIGNMFEIGRGYVIPKKDIKDRKSGQYIYPIYSSQTLNNGLLGYYKKYLKSNAITWTTDGANAGTISYRKDRFYATNVCGILSTKVFAPNIYLALALSKIAYKHVTKVGNPKLMNNIMSNIDILISSNLPEQNKISFLFSNLDSLITLHQWECNFWKFRNFVFDFLKFSTRFFKKIQKYTHTWEQEKLGNLGVFKSSSVDKIIRNNEQFINLINYMDVYNKLIITSKNINKLMRVTASKKQINECSILKNDVLFTPSSETADDIAHSKVIEETLKNTLFSYHLIRYRPNQNIFYSLFPDYLFDTNHFKKQASLLAKGVQRFVLGKPEFESLNVIFPNINEQTKITKTFRYIDSLITLHQRGYKWREK